MVGLPGRELEDRLVALGIPKDKARLFGSRKDHSQNIMHELRRNLEISSNINTYPSLAIYATGSYARGEASKHSDIDLFFIRERQDDTLENPRLKEMMVMSDIILSTQKTMRFPPPSNDGEFLRIIGLEEILKHLGGPDDDYKNHFTARLLLLLESFPITGAEHYTLVIENIIGSYLRDYEDHTEDFRPTFIVNDIIRFWKTLCLNYEHKRNQTEDAKKIKQKIRNFKLGFSRLMTCFATVALLSSYKQITKEDLVKICQLTPIERLLLLYEQQPRVKDPLVAALTQYHWFLEKTQKPTSQLEIYFSDKNNRKEAFTHASKFGDAIYAVVFEAANQSGTLRYLVV